MNRDEYKETMSRNVENLLRSDMGSPDASAARKAIGKQILEPNTPEATRDDLYDAIVEYLKVHDPLTVKDESAMQWWRRFTNTVEMVRRPPGRIRPAAA